MLDNNHELYAMARHTLTKNNFEQDDDTVQELVLYALENEKYFDENKGRWDYYMFFAMQRRLLQICSTKLAKKRWNGLIPYSLDYEYNTDDKTTVHLYDLIPDTYDFKEEFHKQELLNELMELAEEPLRLWLNGKTHSEIGDKFGYSRTNAARVIQKNIEKIKDYCKKKN